MQRSMPIESLPSIVSGIVIELLSLRWNGPAVIIFNLASNQMRPSLTLAFLTLSKIRPIRFNPSCTPIVLSSTSYNSFDVFFFFFLLFPSYAEYLVNYLFESKNYKWTVLFKLLNYNNYCDINNDIQWIIRVST